MVDYKSSLHGFLEDPVEFKKGNIKTNSRAKRIVNKATEVMVKITGNAKGEGGVALHLDYISRDGELKLETETGEVIKTEAGIKEIRLPV